jgi:hypothetical protein
MIKRNLTRRLEYLESRIQPVGSRRYSTYSSLTVTLKLFVQCR